MTRTRRRPIVAISAVATMFAGIATTSFAEDARPELTPSLPVPTTAVDRINWALYAEPSSLDPILPNDFPPMEVLANVCESLSRITPSFATEPALASSLEQPDPLTLVYKLRSGVTFQSGAPLTADDVVYSLNRSRSDALGSFHTAVFANVSDIVATAPDEVTIKLSKPDQTLPQALATNAGRIVNKASTEAQARAFGGPGSTIDCTGPYRLASWRAGEGITLEKFDGYWDKARVPKAEKLTLLPIPDASAAVKRPA